RQGKEGKGTLSIAADGSFRLGTEVNRSGASEGTGKGGMLKGLKPVGQWNRLGVTLKEKSIAVSVNGGAPTEFSGPLPPKGTLALEPEGEMEFGNLFVRELGK